MHIRLIAVGDRQPSWVESAFSEYSERLPRQWQFRLHSIATARRGKNLQASESVAAEGKKVLAQIRGDDIAVVLDERGRTLSSKELADRVGDWQTGGRDVCFVIGGPDGVSDECRDRADLLWSLSRHTLPHGLARVFLVEQLYRAWSLLNGHPYHRE